MRNYHFSEVATQVSEVGSSGNGVEVLTFQREAWKEFNLIVVYRSEVYWLTNTVTGSESPWDPTQDDIKAQDWLKV